MSPEKDGNDLSVLKIEHDENFSYEDMKKRKWGRIATAAVAAVIVMVLVVWNPFSSAREVQVTTVVTLSPSQMATILNASGYVVAQRMAAVASKATGRLVSMAVEEGDHVKEDEVIAHIESDDVEAQLAQGKANYEAAVASVAQAQAQLNEATLQYERMKSLIDDNLISRTEFDTAEARYKSALAAVEAGKANARAIKAGVEALNVAVENTRIRAPFDGTVLNKYADIGEIVAPFAAGANARAAVVTIADMNSLQIEADVSESNIERIKLGMPCEIILDAYPEKTYHGVVHKIVPTVDRSKATVLTKIRFADQDDLVLPEMSARVSFLSEAVLQETASGPQVAVYSSAVVRRDGRKVAFRVKGDSVEEVTVEADSTVGDYLEIRSGLAPGDVVVLNPADALSTGSRIRLAQ
jgi:RND family efflux transporter MFP subunit